MNKKRYPEMRYRKVSGEQVSSRLPDRILTVREISEKLKVSQNTVRWWLREGRIIGFRVGCRWRVKERELLKFLDMREDQEVLD